MSSSTISKNAQLYSTYDNRTVPDSQLYSLLYNANIWVDASDTSTFTLTGTGIQQTLSGNWLDKSKHANNLVPTAAGIYYDDGNKGFVLVTHYFMPTFPIRSANSGALFVVIGFWGSINSGTQYILGFNPSNGAGQQFFRIDTAGLLSANNTTNFLVGATPILEGKRYLIGFNNNNGFHQHFINGKLDGSFSGTTFSSTNPSAFFGSASANTQIRAVVHECIYFSGGLSANNRQLIEYYLMNKWKLPANTITNPTSVSGCRLWLDASDATTITTFGGTIVTGWADKSGFSNNATGMSSYQPGYSAGTPAITFNTTQGMTTPYVPAAAGETMFLVLKTTTISSAASQYFIDSSNVTSGRNFRITGTGNTRIYVSGGGSNALLGLIGITAQTFTTHFLYCATFSSGGIAQFINKVRDRNATGSFVPTAGTYTQIGSRNTPPATGLNGSISEIVAYNLVLSGSDRELVSNYLMNKWNIPCISGTLVNTYNGFQNIPPRLRYFTPNDIENCTLWLDAADMSTLFTDSAGTIPVTASGQTVGFWRDKSPVMNNATQTTSSRRPTTTFNDLNGLNALTFTAANSTFLSLTTPSLTLTGTTYISIFIVLNVGATSGTFLSLGSPASAFTLDTPATLTLRLTPPGGTGGISDNTTFTSTNTYYVCSLVLGNGTNGGYMSVNGVQKYNSNPTAAFTVGTTRSHIGSTNALTPAGFMEGKICEVIIYPYPVSIGEKDLIDGYLADKWGLRSTFPTVHPLKDINPLSLPFNPRSISTCTFWYDIADKSTITYAAGSTVNVTAVKDKSGLGINLNRTTYTAGFEITTASTLNGLPTLTFPADPADNNNTLSYLSSTVPVPMTSASNYVFFVMRFNPYVLQGTSTARSWGIIYPVSIFVNFGMQGGLRRTAGNWTLNYGVAFVGDGANGTSIVSNSSSGPSVGTPFIGMFGKTAAAQYVFSYNGTYETKAGASYTIVGGQPMNVGIFYQAQELCEMIFYQGKVLTTQEIQKIEGYLAWKWGLVGNLPATHIYKKYPP